MAKPEAARQDGASTPPGSSMRILLVYCHPSPASYVASIRDALAPALEARGHVLDLIDLYADGFSPVLDRESWRAHREDRNAEEPDLARHIDALRAAEGIVLVYPTWWYGLPAMLKGWFDRVWQPNVAFTLEDGRFQIRHLSGVRRFAVVTTYGSPGWIIKWVVGDPARRMVMRGLALQFARGVKTTWAPIYGVDGRSEAALAKARDRAVERIVRRMDAG
jgi:NAD(P)H dehydrogenase (quinone)